MSIRVEIGISRTGMISGRRGAWQSPLWTPGEYLRIVDVHHVASAPASGRLNSHDRPVLYRSHVELKLILGNPSPGHWQSCFPLAASDWRSRGLCRVAGCEGTTPKALIRHRKIGTCKAGTAARHGNPEMLQPGVILEYHMGHARLQMQHLVLHIGKKVPKTGRNFTLYFYCIFGWGRKIFG